MSTLSPTQAAGYSSSFASSRMGLGTPSETTLFQKAINATAADLFREMCKSRSIQNKNFIFFTPNLIASLSMLYAGAPDALKKVMEQALHMGEVKGEKWHSNFREWSEGIQQRSTGQTMLKTQQLGFKFQHSQIIAYHIPLVSQARKSLSQYSPEMLPFSHPEEAKKLINERVSQKTEGKIQNLVEEVGSDLVLIMASAALFKGQWKYPFEKDRNSQEVFFNDNGTEVRVEMMNKFIGDLRTAHDYNEEVGYDISILELPFHGDISLLLIKPQFGEYSRMRQSKVQDCAEQLENFMTERNLQDLLDHSDARFYKTRNLSIGVPKLKLQDKTDILEELKNTQLAQALTEANFSGSLLQCSEKTKTPQLISEVNFTMDEEGAVIAAASAVLMSKGLLLEFTLNGPFGLAIVDQKTGTLLGMGRVLQL